VAYYADASAESRLILRDAAETLSATFYFAESAVDADGAITVGIVDEAGATVVASGTSTTSVGSGVYSYSLAAQSSLKRLIVTWTGTFGGNSMDFDTYAEVVGGFYATPAEVRAMPEIVGESATFSAAAIVDAIAYATQIVDDYCGASFVQRYERDLLNGTNSDTIKVSKMFPTTIISASIDGTALTSGKIAEVAKFDDGQLVRKSDIWAFTQPGNGVIIEYEHGASTHAPNDIRWAARTLARYHLLEEISRIPSQATQIQSEFGSITMSQPGMNRPTPMPPVNTVLNRHRHRAPTAF